MDQSIFVVGILLLVCGSAAYFWADQDIGMFAAFGGLLVLFGAALKGSHSQTAQKQDAPEAVSWYSFFRKFS